MRFFPPLENGPILTTALQSSEILIAFGALSVLVLIVFTCLKMASFSGTFRMGSHFFTRWGRIPSSLSLF